MDLAPLFAMYVAEVVNAQTVMAQKKINTYLTFNHPQDVLRMIFI